MSRKHVPIVPPAGPNHCGAMLTCGHDDVWTSLLCTCPCIRCREWVRWSVQIYLPEIVVLTSLEEEIARVRSDRRRLRAIASVMEDPR